MIASHLEQWINVIYASLWDYDRLLYDFFFQDRYYFLWIDFIENCIIIVFSLGLY